MDDTYPNFDSLAKTEKEDVDFRVRLFPRERASLVIIAPHGGAIEPGTSEIALGVAGNDYSCALFEGTKPKNNAILHITSGNFDEPRFSDLVAAHRQTLAIHGEKNAKEMIVYIGGRDLKMGAQIRASLERHGYAVAPHPSASLQGTDPNNICNRNVSKSGIQLELTEALRRTFFAGWDAEGRKQPTPELTRFVNAIREGLVLPASDF